MSKINGIVRRMDDLGRICIPKEMRRALNIGETDSVEIEISNDTITIKKVAPETEKKFDALIGSLEVSGEKALAGEAKEILKKYREINK